MKKLLSILLLFAASYACAQGPAKTTVADTVYSPDGKLLNATLRITNGTFTSADGYVIPAGSITVSVVNGALSIPLVPTAGANPAGQSYRVDYFLSVRTTETWTVPNTGTTNLAGVRALSAPIPTVMLAMSQVNPPAPCTTGQVLTWNGSSWTCATPSAGGGGTWGSITGTLCNQADLCSAFAAKAADSAVVHNTGIETIAGAKTFSSTISGNISGNAAGLSANITESQVTSLVSDLAAKAADSAVVHNTGIETIAGAKTFSSTIAGSISGNAVTATALAANGANCSAGNAAAGVDASGAAEGCAALPANTTSTASNFLTAYNSTTGAFTKAQPAFTDISGTATSGQLPAAVVYNNQANTFGAFLQKFQAGANLRLTDTTDTTKTAGFDLSNITTATNRTVNVPDANSTTVQANAGSANNFVTAISAQGVVSLAQPSFSNLSGSVAAGQMPALTGDATTSAGAVVTTLATVATPGTNTKVTYNAKGLVTSGAQASLTDLAAASGSTTYADGNNPIAFNSAQSTDSQAAVTFGETSAATAGTVTNALANQSALKTSTASASTATPLSIVQGGVTGTTAFPAAQFQTTWNNASLTGEGLLFNVTDTSSAAASLLLDLRKSNVTQAKIDKTGNLTVTSATTSGSTAGSVAYTQGSTQSTGTNNITEQAPTAVTSYLVTKPGIAAQGINVGTLSGTTITQGFSGDTNHSATVTVGSGTSIGSTQLCSTTFCPAGTYRINAYLDLTTACGTSGTYSVSLVWTDDQASKTVVIPMQGTGESAGVLTTTTVSNFGQAAMIIRSTGAASINYLTTAVACGSAGPMVGKLYLSVEPVQ